MALATSIREEHALAVGDVFVNHRIEGLAGRGGMGVVYRAIDLDLDRTVALKVIAPAFAAQPEFRSRFVAESKTTASIEHQHVIPVYYAGERDGVLFIVMRYVDGPDLHALVRACGPLHPRRAAHVVAQVAGALDAAHARRLVHRDVKPANILLDGAQHAYLTDFGLTKRVGASSPGWVGTPAYVAPEQIRGEDVDASADVYALGCVLVHALTGCPPYVCDCDAATLRAHLDAPPPSERVPPAFAGVVERALAKDPRARFHTAGELGRAALLAAGAQPEGDAVGELGRAAHVAAGARPPGGAAGALTAPRRPQATWLPAQLGETQGSPRPGRSRLRSARRRATALGAPVLVVCAFILAQPGPTQRTVPQVARALTPPAGRVAAVPVRVGARPDAVAATGGRVWVLSSAAGEIHVLDAATGRRLTRIDLGRSDPGAAISAGYGAVWAVKASTRSLIRLDTRVSHRHVDTPIRIDVRGLADRLAVGAGAVWLAARDPSGVADTIVRIDPWTYGQRDVAVPPGTQHIATGQDALWVTNARLRTVTRIDGHDLSTETYRVAATPGAIAVTARTVWITSGTAVVRIDPVSGTRARVELGRRATRIVVAGGSAWVVAGRELIGIDPSTLRVRERTRTAGAAGALASSGARALWLALPGAGAAQRVAIARGRPA